MTSATGSIEGSGASLLGTASATYETSPSNTFYYDDLLFLGSTPTNLDVDTYGLLFTSDGLEWNLYSNGGAPGTEALQSDGGEYFTGDITVVAVPEPATWGLMILGVGLMGTGLRMVRRKTALASV